MSRRAWTPEWLPESANPQEEQFDLVGHLVPIGVGPIPPEEHSGVEDGSRRLDGEIDPSGKLRCRLDVRVLEDCTSNALSDV